MKFPKYIPTMCVTHEHSVHTCDHSNSTTIKCSKYPNCKLTYIPAPPSHRLPTVCPIYQGLGRDEFYGTKILLIGAFYLTFIFCLPILSDTVVLVVIGLTMLLGYRAMKADPRIAKEKFKREIRERREREEKDRAAEEIVRVGRERAARIAREDEAIRNEVRARERLREEMRVREEVRVRLERAEEADRQRQQLVHPSHPAHLPPGTQCSQAAKWRGLVLILKIIGWIFLAILAVPTFPFWFVILVLAADAKAKEDKASRKLHKNRQIKDWQVGFWITMMDFWESRKNRSERESSRARMGRR